MLEESKIYQKISLAGCGKITGCWQFFRTLLVKITFISF
jgi:hypothetical protein